MNEISIPAGDGYPYEVIALSAGESSLVHVRNSITGEDVLTFPEVNELGEFLDSLEEAYWLFYDEVNDD